MWTWEREIERFQQRVRQAIDRRYRRTVNGTVRAGTLYQLGKENGLVRKPTVSAWLRKKEPRLPCSEALLQFARETDTSLNWLLLSRGQQQLGPVHQSDGDALLRAYLLRAVEHYEQHERKARRKLIEELAAKVTSGQVSPTPAKPPRKRAARR